MRRGTDRWAWNLAAACLSLGLLVTATSHAAPPAERADAAEASGKEPAEYKRVVARAVREFDAGNYPEARSLFTRAHELYANARTYLGLGLVAFELRNYGTCVEYLETALGSTTKPLNDSLRKSAQDVLGKARGMIAQVNLEVSPTAARVLLDGVPVALPDGQALVLEVGDHVIEVQASGYLSERRSLSIVGGEQLKLSVVMRQPEAPPAALPDAIALQAPGPQPDDRQVDKPRRWVRSPWLWVSVGVVVAAGGVTAALLLRPEAKVEPNPVQGSDNTPPGGMLQALQRW